MTGFDGLAGTIGAVVMARMNADMERAALEPLRPRDGEQFLVVGFGPGVGLIELFKQCRPASVIALDPSAAMLRAARRRLARHGQGGIVTLIQDTAARAELQAGSIDAAIAVNTHQLWEPHLDTIRNLAHALRPSGRVVSVTHEWAIAKHKPVADWIKAVTSDLLATGFKPPTWTTDNYRSGRGIALQTTKT